MLKVGITGGIGSGKSMICSVFKVLGVPVFAADEVGRDLLNSDSNIGKYILDHFGTEVFGEDGKPDRKKIAEIVFANPDKLREFDSIMHPRVKEIYNSWLFTKNNSPYVIHEAAILIESEFYKLCEIIILVEAPLNLRINRVIKRDGLSTQEIKQRMVMQYTDEQRRPFGDYTIMNDENSPVLQRVLDIHNSLLKMGEVKT